MIAALATWRRDAAEDGPNGADPVQERQPARSAHRRAPGWILGPRRGRNDPRGFRKGDQGCEGRRDRLQGPHADARPDRLPRSRDALGGEPPLSRSDPADDDDGARREPDARDDRSRLHDGARYRRRGLGASRRRRAGPSARAEDVHRRPRDRSHRWTLGCAPPHRSRPRRVSLLQCNAFLPRGRRRRRRGAQGGARADAPRRRSDQDHGLRRRREPLRSSRQPAVHARGDRRRRRGGRSVRSLRAGARVHARRDHARGEQRVCARSSMAT